MPTCLSSSEPTATRRLSDPQAKRSQTTGALSWIRCKTLAWMGLPFASVAFGPSRQATAPTKTADRPAPPTTDQPTCILLPFPQVLLLATQEGQQQGHNLAVHAHGRPRHEELRVAYLAHKKMSVLRPVRLSCV